MKLFRRIVSKIIDKIYLLLAIFLVVFAILVTIARALTPVLEHYNHNFAMWAETFLHKPVQIGQVKAGWAGFHPVLDLHNVVILDKKNGKTVFKLEDLQVSLNIAKSLLEHKVIINHLFIKGMHVVIFENKHKQWTIKGLTKHTTTANNGSEDFTAVESWLLSQPQLILQNVDVLVQSKQHKPLTINNLDLVLSNTSDRHDLQGHAFLAKQQKSPVNIVVNLQGDANDIKNLQGDFYFQTDKAALSNWFADKSFYGFKCKQGDFSFKLWGKWQNQQADNIQTNINLTNLILQLLNNTKSLIINKLSANLFWKHLANGGWELNSDKIMLMLDNKKWDMTKFGIWVLQPTTREKKQLIEVNFLKLEDLKLLLSQLTLLPTKIRQAWQHFSPAGELKNVQTIHQGDFKKIDHFHLQAGFSELQWKNYQHVPGISGLTGQLNMTAKAGQIVLASQQLNFSAKNLFRQTLPLKQLSGLLQWHKTNKTWSLQAYKLNVVSPEINLHGNMNLLLPGNKKSPRISLLATYSAQHLGKVKRYFPAKIMAPSLVKWLDHAFVSGTAAQGSLLLFGPLQKFPFLKNEGQFIVDSNIHDLEFNYLPDWPNINHASGNLVFTKHQMHFTLKEGSLAKQKIKNLVAVIPDMAARPQSRLHIRSQILLDKLTEAKQFILQSPLRTSIGKNIAPLQMQGKGVLTLKLNIPLEHGDTLTYGNLALQHSALSLPEWGLHFKNINGALHFTDNSLSAKNLQARFFNEPAKVNIKTLQLDKMRMTRFNVLGKAKVSDIKKYFKVKEHGFVTGNMPFSATLDIPATGKTHLSVKSYLHGVKINLPQPYYKKSETRHRLQIDSYFTDTQAPWIKILYAGLMSTTLAYAKQQQQFVFSRANINLGAGDSKLPTQPGIFISGSIDNFIWEKWKNILSPYLQPSKNKPATGKQDNATLKSIKLKIKNFKAFKQQLTDVALSIVSKFNSWIFTLNSNKITGTVTVPKDYKHKTTIGYFKNLTLEPAVDDNKKTADQWDPRSILPLSISADQFNYGEHHYGKISLSVTPLQNGLQVSSLNISNPFYTLAVKGKWLQINKKNHSSFSGSLSTKNLDELLKQENFTNHIYRGKGEAKFKLNWPDKPSAFQNKDLQGTISAKFTDGTITGLNEETNQKIGLGKLINVLSLPNIVKHLTFNFGKKGYGFSEMRGDLKLQNGKLSTNNAYLNGSVAEIYIRGDLGLKKQFYNLNVTVNPYITSSLPILATLVGGPVVGVATWAVSKLARAGVRKAVIYQYHIGGTWKDPIVKNINVKK